MAFFYLGHLKRRARARQKAPRALNAILVSFNFVSVNCFSKSQRERANYGALALADFANDLIHFQKNDFWYRVHGQQKSFF